MKAKPGQLRLRGFASAFLLFLQLLTVGCGGITATKSFSPLDFFMPGLLKCNPLGPPDTQSVNILLCVRSSILALSDAAAR